METSIVWWISYAVGCYASMHIADKVANTYYWYNEKRRFERLSKHPKVTDKESTEESKAVVNKHGEVEI